MPAGYTITPDNPDPLFPNAIPRLVTIAAGYINAPAEYTDGVDFDFNAHFDLGAWGRLSEEFSAARILSFVFEQTGSPNLQYAGTQSPYNLSSGAGTPQDRATLSNTWCLTTALGFAANAANCRVGSFTYANVNAPIRSTASGRSTAPSRTWPTSCRRSIRRATTR